MEELDWLLATWCADGRPAALATVVSTSGSTPRPPGAWLAVAPDGSVIGSVSGGCVEGAVYEAALEAMESGRSSLHGYGVSDESAIEVGLTCGGRLEVLVTPLSGAAIAELAEVVGDVRAGRPVCVATVIAHPDAELVGRRVVVRPGAPASGTTGRAAVDAAIEAEAVARLSSGATAIRELGPAGERLGTGLRVFFHVHAPRPRLLVFGAIDFAASVARLGALLGLHVTVCDARALFATPARFPEADEVVVDWPHRYLAAEIEAGRIDARTSLCVLTHDPKFDLPLLEVALRAPAGVYVGAMGSRRTHERRVAELRARGLADAELARLHGPIGLDLGARTPDETAVSIAAEMIAFRSGATGLPLHATSGPIHGEGLRLSS